MKNLSVTVAVTALMAFSLGYFARGVVEHTPNVSSGPEELALREHTASAATQAQTIVGSDQNDAGAPFIASSNQEVVITSERSSSRERYMKIRLGDFFLINSIGSEKAEQIEEGDEVEIILTAEEKAELYVEQESLYRQILDEYYEAYEEYNRTSLQRRVVGMFSSSLQEPLEHAAKESLVQIMHEESSRFESELSSKSAGSGAHLTSNPQGWEAQKKKSYERLLGMQPYNERVLDRTKTYLTPSQFDQLKRRLGDDLRRFELLIELADIDEAN